MPLYLIGNAGLPILLAGADAILILTSVFMVFKGMFMAKRLTKALSAGGNVDESRKFLVKTITKTIYVLSGSCLSGTGKNGRIIIINSTLS